MRKLFFYIPFLYSFHSRLSDKSSLLEFIAFDVIISALLVFASGSVNFLMLALGFVFVYSFYEFGYIQNDAETIKKEINPTLRLSEEELSFYENHKLSIYSTRVIWCIFYSILLYYIDIKWQILVLGLATVLVFLSYNHIRSKWNLYIHILLMFLRFSIPVFICLNTVNVTTILWILLFYPIERFILLSIRGKCGYQNELFKKLFFNEFSRHNIRIFNLKYYLVFNVVSLILCCLSILSYLYLIPSVYWMLLIVIRYKGEIIK